MKQTHFEVCQLVIRKYHAGTLLHYDIRRNYDSEPKEIMIFPKFGNLHVRDQLAFCELSEQDLEKRDESKHGMYDVIYEVGNKDIVTIELDHMFNGCLNDQYEGIEFLHSHERLAEAIKPIADKMKYNKYERWQNFSKVCVLSIWRVEEEFDDYEYDCYAYFECLVTDDALRDIVKAKKKATNE